ncbi:MAG: tyrosine-type recombinase/integrase [Chloroflexia bacterium]
MMNNLRIRTSSRCKDCARHLTPVLSSNVTGDASAERAGIAYFRSFELPHTCATLLLYEGRTLNEVAEHLGHADPGFTARTYAHVMRDASRRRLQQRISS